MSVISDETDFVIACFACPPTSFLITATAGAICKEARAPPAQGVGCEVALRAEALKHACRRKIEKKRR